jgi:hypothetical protein
MRAPVDSRIPFGIEDDLRDAGPVAQIDEHDHPVITAPLHPAVQYHSLPHMGLIQFAAPMRPQLHATLAFFG